MTTYVSRRPLVASGVAVLLAAGLSACYGPASGSSNNQSSADEPSQAEDVGGDVDAFCDDFTALHESRPSESSKDLDEKLASMKRMGDAIDPPREIQDDWGTYWEARVELMEQEAELDRDSETYEEDYSALVEETEETFDEERDAVRAFFEKNCAPVDAE